MSQRYAANDPDSVVAMIDPKHFTMFGSDVSEVVHSGAELRSLMRDDFALWRSANFGEIEHFDFRTEDCWRRRSSRCHSSPGRCLRQYPFASA